MLLKNHFNFFWEKSLSLSGWKKAFDEQQKHCLESNRKNSFYNNIQQSLVARSLRLL